MTTGTTSAPPPGGDFLGLTPQNTGILFGLLAPLLWSSSGLFVKLLTLEPLTISCLRAGIAGVALLPFLRLKGLRVNGALIVTLTGYTMAVTAYVIAVKWTTAANAIALISTAPAWVMLMSWIVARRIVWHMAWPVGLILLGVVAMLSEPTQGKSMEGNLIALGGGMGFGLFTYFMPRVNLGGPAMVSLANVVAALAVLPVGILAFQPQTIAVWEWGALLYLGLVQIGLATLCYTAALKRIPVMQASILAMLEPLLVPLWVFLVVGEHPSRYGAVGFVCILLGVIADFVIRRRMVVRAGNPA